MAIKSEFEEIKRFQKDLEQCMKCGFCAFWCPVYQEELVESSVARGKNIMVRKLLSGELDYTKEFAERLNKCTLCMTCTANCPARAQIPDVIVAARADTVKARGVKFPYSFIYRRLLPRRRLFGTVVRIASWFQGVFMPRTKGAIRHLAFYLSALGKGRQIPEIAPKFLRQLVPEVNKPPQGVKTTVTAGYFTGCMTEYVFPGVGQKIVDFLTRQGVEVVVPRQQGCCGAPVFLGAGDFETGREYADANVKAFEDLYLNGKPEIDGKAKSPILPTVAQFFVGGRCDSDSNFEGRLDETAIYDRALTADEVTKLYRAATGKTVVAKAGT